MNRKSVGAVTVPRLHFWLYKQLCVIYAQERYGDRALVYTQKRRYKVDTTPCCFTISHTQFLLNRYTCDASVVFTRESASGEFIRLSRNKKTTGVNGGFVCLKLSDLLLLECCAAEYLFGFLLEACRRTPGGFQNNLDAPVFLAAFSSVV